MPTVIISIIPPIMSEAGLRPPTTMKPPTMPTMATGRTYVMMLVGAVRGSSGGGSMTNSPSGMTGCAMRGRRANARVAMCPPSRGGLVGRVHVDATGNGEPARFGLPILGRMRRGGRS